MSVLLALLCPMRRPTQALRVTRFAALGVLLAALYNPGRAQITSPQITSPQITRPQIASPHTNSARQDLIAQAALTAMPLAAAPATSAPAPALAASAPLPGAAELTILSPLPDRRTTTRDQVHLLGRTLPGAQVRVGGVPVTVQATGVFARDQIPLALGDNALAVEARLPDGRWLATTLVVQRTAPVPPPGPMALPTDRLAIDRESLQPRQTLRVAPGEPVEVALRGTAGAIAEARLPGERDWHPLTPAHADPTRYHGTLAYAPGPDSPPGPVEFRLRRPEARAASHRATRAAPRLAPEAAKAPQHWHGPREVQAAGPADVGRWQRQPSRLVEAGPEGAELLNGRHEVRLGGPFIAEVAPGTLLRITGQVGEHLRVALAADTTAWVLKDRVAPAPAGTTLPHAQFTSLSVAGDDAGTNPGGDVVSIPVPPRLAWALQAQVPTDANAPAALVLDLYGAHRAATWITHRASARLVREVTVEQPADGRVQVRIALNDHRLWGWRVEREGGQLKVRIRPAPAAVSAHPQAAPLATPAAPLATPSTLPAALATPSAPASPLSGLRVALEPGHGGPTNLGAVGATGIPEKEVNRWTVEALKAELERAGAQVTVVREGDENPPHAERVRRAMAADADLFVSVHANATDTERGFLRTQGTSTYYKHGHARELAAAVQRRLLAHTGLADFGLVGAFNYHPIRRLTWMPAILVEQAFMSHPADEAAMLDAGFRARTAEAVRLGLEDFVRGR